MRLDGSVYLIHHDSKLQNVVRDLNMDTQITKFKIKGRVYLWKYKENARNYPGWNLTMNNPASNSLTELLDLMKYSEYQSRKKVKITTPTSQQLDVPNNRNGQADFISVNNLLLNFEKFEDPNFWKIIENDDQIELRFGSERLTELKKAIMGIPEGEGDFAISDERDENILYLWWNSEK